MNIQGIYKITNLSNQKVYIGSSLNLDKRIYEHKRLLRLGKHENVHLQNSWNKYGEDNFIFEVIDVIDVIDDYDKNNKILRDLETGYIQKYNSFNSNFGYNIIRGGIGTVGIPCTEEKRKKISDANKGREAYNKGVSMSSEQKELLQKIHTEKTGIKIDIYTQNRIFLETLSSVHEVHRKYGTSRNTIKEICLNLRMPKGLIFRFHGDSLDTLGSCKPIIEKSEEEIKQKAEHYRKVRGKPIDVYDSYGNYIETLPAVVAVHEKYNISESTIRKGLKEKTLSGGNFFRYSGEKLGEIDIKKYCNKVRNNNLSFYIYENGELIDVIKYKKDVEKYAKPREKSKLQKLLSSCNKCGDEFIYHNYIIKFEIAPRNSNISSEPRQSNPSIGGTDNISANGEA